VVNLDSYFLLGLGVRNVTFLLVITFQNCRSASFSSASLNQSLLNFCICFFLDLFVSAVYFCLTRRGHGKPATSRLPTPKVHFSNLDKQPKEITRYPTSEYPKPDSFFHDGQIKDANDKRKEWNFGGPQV
jgi:hypothetical protein